MGIKKKKTQTRTKPGGTSVRPMLNVRKDTTSDRYTLVIRILRARRRGVVFTPFKLLPEEFDPVKGRAVPNLNIREHRRFVDNVNRYLRHQLHEIDRIVSELELVGEPFDGRDVAAAFRERYDNRYVHTVFRRQIEELLRQGRHGTAGTYRSTLVAFGKFAGKRHYQLCELDEPAVMEFRDFLVREGLSVNTMTFYLSKLRAVYNRAVREGFAPKGLDPFEGVPFRVEKTRKLAVDDTVLRLVAGADLPRGPLAVARDLFLFSFYCRGMSFVDMAYLRQGDIDGDVIRYRRRKTGQLFMVRIIAPLRAILDRYRDICSPLALPIPTDSVPVSSSASWPPTKWFGQDTGENPAGYLDVEQLSEAIPSGVFDWILFDACFMASAETLYALRVKAERIVCSPAEVIADSFPYAEIMAELLRPEPDLRAVCETYYRNYADDPRPAYRSATVSLIETSQFEALAEATASVLGAALTTDPEALAGMELNRLQPLDRYRRHFLFDMGSVVRELETRGLVPASVADVWRAQLARTVIYEAHTPTMLGLSLDECCGLSMYVPYADYADLNEYYRTLEWYRQCYPADYAIAQ